MNGSEPEEPSDKPDLTAHLGIKPNTDHHPDEISDEDTTPDTHDHPRVLEIDDTEAVTEEPGDDPMEEEACPACTKPTLETVTQFPKASQELKATTPAIHTQQSPHHRCSAKQILTGIPHVYEGAIFP